MTDSINANEVIDKAAQVIKRRQDEIYRGEEWVEDHKALAQALYDAGLLASPERTRPTRGSVVEALSVTDVHHPDLCDCGTSSCGGACDASGMDCFCEPEICEGLHDQADAILALLDAQPTVAEAKARAWQEGHGFPSCDEYIRDDMCWTYHRNPYIDNPLDNRHDW